MTEKNDRDGSCHRWATGQVLSRIDGKPFTGKIDITHHQQMLFITAPQAPCDLQLIREAVGKSQAEPPETNITMESYVRLSILPKDLQDQIREIVAVGVYRIPK